MDAERRRRASEDSDLRASRRTAAGMLLVGVVLLLLGLAMPDERVRILLVGLGGLTAAVGGVTIVYARIQAVADQRARSRG